MTPLRIAHRVILRSCLSAAARERAVLDLVALHTTIAQARGPRAASRALWRELLLVVGWAWYDRLRQGFERPGSHESTRRTRMFGDLLHDLRIGLRSLARRPGFAVMTVVVLGLGLSATTAIFTLAHRLFFQPPPLVQDDSGLVRLFRSSSGGYGSTLSYPDYLDYRGDTRTLAGVMAWSSPAPATGRTDGEVLQLRVTMVSDNYFDVLGIRPLVGRFFRAEENSVPEGHPVAVVSWGFWSRELGGRRDAIGRTFALNDRSFTVIGVVPREFRGVLPTEVVPDLYIPVMMLPAVSPQGDAAWRMRDADNVSNWLYAVGRLAPEATVAQAQSELATVAMRIHPAVEGEAAPSVLVTSQYRWYPTTWESLSRLTTLLFGAVLVLLFVAAANVTVLLLARATARGREIGIRAALGAGRNRVIRQLLAESLLLGLGGGALGLLLSIGASRVVGGLLPVSLDLSTTPAPSVLGFALLLSVGTAIGVGTVPAWRAARHDVSGLIHGRTGHAGGGRLRDVLVVFQVALSLILVTGTALFTRSLAAARSVDLGFDTRGILLVGLDLGSRGYDAERGAQFVARALEQLAALPGVQAVSLTGTVPFRDEWSTRMEPWGGRRFADASESMTVGLNTVAPGYFETVGMPLVQGRPFEPGDGAGAPPVIVVNETFARRAFPDGDALGQVVPMARSGYSGFTIVGIAKDATYYDFGELPQVQVFFPVGQVPRGRFALLVRTEDDPLTHTNAVVRTISRLDPSLPVGRIETLESLYAGELASYRASANVVGLAGSIALLLASVGLFGVMMFRVGQQTREIGVRMALGATRQHVARGVLTRGLRLTALGALVGVAGSLALGRFIEDLLFAVPALDPISLVTAPVVLLLVATMAILIPARRAMRVDPVGAIRSE